jgi:hypothetical protein
MLAVLFRLIIFSNVLSTKLLSVFGLGLLKLERCRRAGSIVAKTHCQLEVHLINSKITFGCAPIAFHKLINTCWVMASMSGADSLWIDMRFPKALAR